MPIATPIDLAVLAVVGLVAGWINTVAGAGSLLLLPALIFTGLPPDAANATNRLAILATALTAMVGYRREGLRLSRKEAMLIGAASIGGSVGAFIATLLSASNVQIAIIVMMAVMLVLSLLPLKKTGAAIPDASGGMLAVFFVIGIYGGFLQAGVGIFVLYLAHAHGVGMVTSNVLKSTIAFCLTVVAITVFWSQGETIDPVRGGVLAIGSAIGSLAGVKATIAGGDRLIRAMVAIAVLASLIKLIVDLVR